MIEFFALGMALGSFFAAGYLYNNDDGCASHDWKRNFPKDQWRLVNGNYDGGSLQRKYRVECSRCGKRDQQWQVERVLERYDLEDLSNEEFCDHTRSAR